jgi:hypothetical protein
MGLQRQSGRVELLEDNDRVVDFVKPFAEWGSAVVEILGVGIIVLFSFYALGLAAFRLFKGRQYDPLFKEARQKLGRGILVGLEFLEHLRVRPEAPGRQRGRPGREL